jgi:ATP-dependent helicase/nuclease subunit A
MSSPAYRPSPDAAQRAEAINPRESFLVQAPAGSGKTELLMQRFLRLLAEVERPEAIVAITFTRKAAGEMIQRILQALRDARSGVPAEKPHEQVTRALAEAALRRDREQGWNILEHPARLRVQTIDSLCMQIAAEMPWLARLGGMPGIEEDAQDLYKEAARRTVLLAGDPQRRDPIAGLLRHLDNDAMRARDQIASMLATREQWFPLVAAAEDAAREPLEEALRRVSQHACQTVDLLVPVELREPWMDLARFAGRAVAAWPRANRAEWEPLLSLVLKSDGGLRKRFTTTEGFPKSEPARKRQVEDLVLALGSVPGLPEALSELRNVPPVRYSDAQWQTTLALLGSLKLAYAQLREVFRERGVADFAEIGIAARNALGDDDQATDLAFHLDSRVDHLLVDEFQDTSRGQLDLIRRLTANWAPDEGRTLFLVGDPMQSIYRFRQAEVGLFLQTRERGIGHLRLKPLSLIANYRSYPGIVDRINAIFEQLFPQQQDARTGAVPFHASEAVHSSPEALVQFHGFLPGQDRQEAERVVALIRESQQRAPEEKIAVLVRARTHLPWVIDMLKTGGISFQAVDIDPLSERPVVLDLVALTRAMLHRADRIAWLAILRAPWCGLVLQDLEKLSDDGTSFWVELQNVSELTEDGQARAARIRDVLSAAFDERGRWPLRQWIERTWIQLGGPSCLEGSEISLADARAYFDYLEKCQSGSELPDFSQFERGLADLYSQPDPAASERLQIMTIHKAKGLEFDTVIVAGLGRMDKSDDNSLVLFHEWDEADQVERLIAPIHETAEKDPLYQYLSTLENLKNKLERVRLLYVAATRAKKALHLLGQAKVKDNGDVVAGPRSMLADLWPALTEQERTSFGEAHAEQATASSGADHSAAPAPRFSRLPRSWSLPPLSGNLSSGPRLLETHEPTFDWVGESLRIAGTVVHEVLRRSRNTAIDIPQPAVLRRLLVHAGVVPSEIAVTMRRVTDALSRIQASERARWILADHREARAEYAISGSANGEFVRGKVDRTFVDASGIRWIIDFKTSVHEGGALEEFLDEQQRRYRDQLERYAQLLAPLGQPVRLGLYFPLLDEWREWQPGAHGLG